jgi:hypothetical protein
MMVTEMVFVHRLLDVINTIASAHTAGASLGPMPRRQGT